MWAVVLFIFLYHFASLISMKAYYDFCLHVIIYWILLIWFINIMCTTSVLIYMHFFSENHVLSLYAVVGCLSVEVKFLILSYVHHINNCTSKLKIIEKVQQSCTVTTQWCLWYFDLCYNQPAMTDPVFAMFFNTLVVVFGCMKSADPLTGNHSDSLLRKNEQWLIYHQPVRSWRTIHLFNNTRRLHNTWPWKPEKPC